MISVDNGAQKSCYIHHYNGDELKLNQNFLLQNINDPYPVIMFLSKIYPQEQSLLR